MQANKWLGYMAAVQLKEKGGLDIVAVELERNRGCRFEAANKMWEMRRKKQE